MLMSRLAPHTPHTKHTTRTHTTQPITQNIPRYQNIELHKDYDHAEYSHCHSAGWSKELHQAVESKKSGDNKKAKVLWAMEEAKDKGIYFYEVGNAKEIETRSQVRLDLSAIHLEGFEQGDRVPSATSEWWSRKFWPICLFASF